MEWSPQQDAALKAVSAWLKDKRGPQVFRLFGYAGTGKTTLARHFAEGLKGHVFYGAFTGKAAMVMRKNGCIGATTIHSMIYSVDVNESTGVTKFRLKDKSEFAGCSLIVIDECSMVDNEIGTDLLSFGLPILVLGDPAQLPAIGGAGFFTECDPDVMLTDIHRQAAESPIIRLATIIREGGRLDYGTYGSSRVIHKSELQQEDVLDADQVLVGRNITRTNYNRRMRELQGRTSVLPQKGDRLVCLKNDRTLGIYNGSLWNVLTFKRHAKGHIQDNCVRMDITSADFDQTSPLKVKVREECFDGRIGEVPWKELRGTQQFDYGLALTVHKAQGSGWENVCLFDESSTFADSRARWLYTGLTRASDRITVIQ
jgi:exodeoxyribonuclease-5